MSAAGGREKRGRGEERKKKGRTSKEEETMMEQARGKGNETPLTHTHAEPACHSYVRQEGKPLLEINYSAIH